MSEDVRRQLSVTFRYCDENIDRGAVVVDRKLDGLLYVTATGLIKWLDLLVSFLLFWMKLVSRLLYGHGENGAAFIDRHELIFAEAGGGAAD